MTEPTDAELTRWLRTHVSEPDPRDPAFCRCGHARTSYRHVDGAYQSTPLTAKVWAELRGSPAGGEGGDTAS